MKALLRISFSGMYLIVSLMLGTFLVISAGATQVVNSLSDVLVPGPGEVTLRSALASAASGESIVFDQSLDGGTIELSIVGETNSMLVGEVMGMTNAPSGPISYLVGYFERDYGKSALYASNNVVIDASALSQGITLTWVGGETNAARVLAVYGDLTLKNVSITGGRSVAVELPEPDPGDEYGQLSTRARGGALAVWGVAHLENCRLYGNACSRALSVPARSRDAGVFGGGIYADIVEITDSVISGNSLTASGVSGGGVFSVGGADASESASIIERSAITGNRISGIFAYGGGVYSDGGGIGNLKALELINCTIARNLVDIFGPSYLFGIGYWRGGAVYMSNGHLLLQSCTVVENQVHGVPRTIELDKPNLAGGIAATIGNAHAVETMNIGHSILASNTVHESTGAVYNQDIFTGSLLHFVSRGNNRIGTLNFSQILVPVGEHNWFSLCRKHYPEAGDQDGVKLSDVLDMERGITYSPDILSVGVSASNPAVLHYAPAEDAVNQIQSMDYSYTFAEYELLGGTTNNFLEIFLGRVESDYGLTNFSATFTTNFETFLISVDLDEETAGNQPYTDPDGAPILTLADTQWFGPNETWPSKLYNYPYIEFWHQLDTALQAENIPGMGPELLGDDAWLALFENGALAENTNIIFSIWSTTNSVLPITLDQTGASRAPNGPADIGAIEYQYQEPPALIMNGVADGGSNVVLRWNSIPGRTYALRATSNLASNTWDLIDGGITSTVPFNIYETEISDDARFYKVEVD